MAHRWSRLVGDPRLWIMLLFVLFGAEYSLFNKYVGFDYAGNGSSETPVVWKTNWFIVHFVLNKFFILPNENMDGFGFPALALVLFGWYVLCATNVWFSRHCARLTVQSAVPGLGFFDHGRAFRIVSLVQAPISIGLLYALWEVQHRILIPGSSNQGISNIHSTEAFVFVRQSWASTTVLLYLTSCVAKAVVIAVEHHLLSRATGPLCLNCDFPLGIQQRCSECGEVREEFGQVARS